MYTSEQIDNYLQDFNNAALGRDLWTHEVHLMIATCYLAEYQSVEGAMNSFKPAIIRLNYANEVNNTGVSGFHESVTHFNLVAVEFFIRHQPDTNSLTDNVNAVINSDLGMSKFPFFFYSHEHLLSHESRKGWQEPDLRPMSDLSKLLQVGSGI